MATETLSLLKTRRLWPLVLAQSCGALNDNLTKNALVVLALFQLGIGGTGLSALAGALFIVPYCILSATAGKLADRFSKPRLIVIYKVAEVALMVGAAVAFLAHSVPGLLAVLVGLGVQASLFSPVKYGLLPEHLQERELVAGNGIIEATTFLSIVVGTVTGGLLILLEGGTAAVGATGILLSLIGLAGALRIPASPPADRSLHIDLNPFRETWRVVRAAASIRPIWLSLLGLSWFWTIGATLLTEFPVVARDTLRSDGSVLTLLLAVFAVGVGFGSIGCARLLKGEVSPRFVPFAAVGISIFCWDFASAAANAGPIATAAAVPTSLAGLRMVIDLFLLAACGGVFSVPLYAIIQDASAPAERSRMIAANNVVNALFMVAGAAAAAALAAGGLQAPGVLRVAAAANLAVAIWIMRILPHEMFRAVCRWWFGVLHGVEVTGLENYRAAGDRAVIVSNHLSYADACLITAYLPDSPTFAIHTAQAAKWYFKPILAAVDLFPVDVQSPYAVKNMVAAVRAGRKLMIFPEGRITRTGALMKVYEGAGLVADKANAKIVPVCIEGLQFTPFGQMAGKLRLRWFPRLRLSILPPVDLTPPDAAALTPRQRREAVGRRLQDAMVEAVFQNKRCDRTLFSAILNARALYGGAIPIAEDAARVPITYDRLIVGAAALGRALRAAAQANGMAVEQRIVGVMLPNAVATIVAWTGLLAFDLVPAMLNFSAGAAAMLAACRAAQVRTVVSSRAFVDKAGLGTVVESMSESVRFVWLEDIKASIGIGRKLRAKLDAMRARVLPGARANPDSWAMILFTSGSEGAPKAVVHSHRSLLTNCAQLSSVIDFSGADIVFNAMPMFHSFGATGAAILPLVSGVRTFHYPSPLHYRIIPGLIYDTDATIVFATDVFAAGWARYAHPYDFYSVRYLFAGAAKVREETRRLYADRFGVRVLEGYGATETAPVLSLNTAMHCRPGSIGRFLPGIETRLDPIPGIEGAGRLCVRGNNVMLGYLRTSAPGVLEPPPDGWYDTGDVVAIDAAGFATIRGRVKRFAKPGGEMVSMEAVEALIASVWPDDQHAVVSIPDERKGEALVLVTTRCDADSRNILPAARAAGYTELMVPRLVVTVSQLPVLGPGKFDYPAIQQLALSRVTTPAEAQNA